MLMSWLASRCGNAVASSATRLIAPPKLKIGTVESGLLIVARCSQIVSITSPVSGPSRCDFQ